MEADTVRIEWPSGTVQEFHHISPRQILTITEPARLQAAITNGTPQFSIRGGRNLQYEIRVLHKPARLVPSWHRDYQNLDGTAVS